MTTTELQIDFENIESKKNNDNRILIASFFIIRKGINFIQRNSKYICENIKITFSENPLFHKDAFTLSLKEPSIKNSSNTGKENLKENNCEINDIDVEKDQNVVVDIFLKANAITIPRETDKHHSFKNQNVKMNIIFHPKSNLKKVKELDFNLTFYKENSSLEASFTLNPDKEKIVYEPDKPINIGTLSVNNKTKHSYSHNLNLKDIELLLVPMRKDEDNNRKSNKKPKTTELHSNCLSVHFDPGDYISTKERQNKADKKFDSFNIEPKETREYQINLLINENKIPHPKDEDSYCIFIRGQKKMDGKSWIDFFEKINGSDFCLTKNTVKTELFFVKYDDDEIEIKPSTKTINDLEKEKYNIASNEPTTVITGKFGNRATTDPDNIQDFLRIEEINFFIYANNINGNSIPNNFNISDSFFLKLSNIPNQKAKEVTVSAGTNGYPHAIDLHNSPSSFIEYEVGFRDADFKQLPDEENRMKIKFNIQYKWSIYTKKNEKDDLCKKKPKTNIHSFSFELHQFEGHDWLSIDFGTSAIVSEFGRNGNVFNNLENNSKILDLQTCHKEIIESNKQIYDPQNIEEFGTPFLSSTVFFDQVNGQNLLEDTTNNTSGVILAPHYKKVESFSKFVLPYLKSIILFEYLPVSIQKRLIQNVDYIGKVPTKNILKAVYISLFKDYIIKHVKNQKFNKLVLAVPNVFTNGHKLILKSIIKSIDALNIWPNYIRFINESDAVACYYSFQYPNLIKTELQSRDNIKESQVDELFNKYLKIREKSDTILVYDMGAGTLDLTLFKIHSETDNRFTLDILGKVGLSIAGNYLDYILAIALWEYLKKEAKDIGIKELWNPFSEDNTHPADTIEYKKYIKTIFKPSLFNEADEIVTIDETTFEDKIKFFDNIEEPLNIEKRDILSHPEFESFTKKCTKQILDLLKNNLKNPGEVITINTVIFSGRGSQIKILKDALKSELEIKEHFQINNDLFFVNLKGDISKSIVSKGSIYYATSLYQNPGVKYIPLVIHARIGYILDKRSGPVYKEIISPKTWIKSKSKIIHKEKINLVNVASLMIIQTYLYDSEVIIKEYSSENSGDLFDTSSLMYKFRQNEDYINKEYNFMFIISKDGSINLKLGNKSVNLYGIPQTDIENSGTFKKSMWPFL